MSIDWDEDEAEAKGAELHEDAFDEPAAPGLDPSLQAAPSIDWPSPPKLSDFFARTDGPIDWLWDRMVMRGSVNILGAYMKVGKSSLVMNIVRGLIEQRHLFDMNMNLGAGRVFWFAPEDSERIIRYNLNHAGIDPSRYEEKLVLVTKGDAYLEKLRGGGSLKRKWAGFKDALKRDNVEVIVLDTMNTFSHYLGLEEENDNQAVTRLMDMISELKEMGLTVLITQHTGKNQERGGTLQSLRGASSYAALADQIMLLTQPGEQGSTRRQLTIIGRTSIDSPAFLNLDYDKSTATYMLLPDDVDMPGSFAGAAAIEAFLRRNPNRPLRAREFSGSGVSRQKVDAILEALVRGESVGNLTRVDGNKIGLVPDPELPFD